MKLGNIRLVRIMRVPVCIVRPIAHLLAEVTGNEAYRHQTYGVLYMTHPVDTFKWVCRYIGRLED